MIAAAIDSKRPTAVIVDMDGTLCDVATALHLLPDLDAFHVATRGCPPTTHVVEWCERAHADGHAVIVVTARMYRHEQGTVDWLAEHFAHVPHIGPLMRGDRDRRSDDEVKLDILRVIRDDLGYDVVAAIDDRPRIIRLWRAQGIPTTVVHRADWEAAGEPYDPNDAPA